MTTPTSLSKKIVNFDLSTHFVNSSDLNAAYLFWGSTTYSINLAKSYLTQIDRQNKLIRAFARHHNIPLLDYEQIFNELHDAKNFKDYFFDIGHPRPKTYPFLAECLNEFATINL
jgi:hypothetical protein